MVEPQSSEPKLYPVQTLQTRNRKSGAIRESVYLAAYEVYAHIHGEQPAMLEGGFYGCRGGFDTGELIAFLYARGFPKHEWRERCDEAFTGMNL